MARFCIVIPTYNSLTTLPAAVESALAQDGDFTVYVSDNASSDGSAAYLKSLDHSRLRLGLWEECLPKTGNWNRAFREAPASEYLVMLHSDDILDAGALAEIRRAADAHPQAALIFGNHRRLSLDGKSERPRHIWPLAYRVGSRRFDRIQFLCNSVSVVGTTFRRDAFEKVGGFPDRYTFLQDMEFFHQLVNFGDAVYVPKSLGFLRDTPERPANSERYVRELVLWLDEHRGAFPRGLSRLLLAFHVRRIREIFCREQPDRAQDFENWLQENHHDRKGAALDPLWLYKPYKLWCALTPFLGNR